MFGVATYLDPIPRYFMFCWSIWEIIEEEGGGSCNLFHLSTWCGSVLKNTNYHQTYLRNTYFVFCIYLRWKKLRRLWIFSCYLYWVGVGCSIPVVLGMLYIIYGHVVYKLEKSDIFILIFRWWFIWVCVDGEYCASMLTRFEWTSVWTFTIVH